ncbi:MAG: bifunctional riboflavin kinase/FAD synthetase, partial [Proteobacteria bacterium]|nr:bifunctional riboflavin kinase/FAD synthetase [Pseudomonadota bacterium]
RVLLETHLFDFDGDIYGCRIEIEFASKIRNEEKFESFQQLKDQIERDAAAARAWFDINS